MSFICMEPIFVKANLVLEVRKLGSSKLMAFADLFGFWSFSNFDNFSTFWQLRRVYDCFISSTTTPNNLIVLSFECF